jgi:hypothetical protein
MFRDGKKLAAVGTLNCSLGGKPLGYDSPGVAFSDMTLVGKDTERIARRAVKTAWLKHSKSNICQCASGSVN